MLEFMLNSWRKIRSRRRRESRERLPARRARGPAFCRRQALLALTFGFFFLWSSAERSDPRRAFELPAGKSEYQLPGPPTRPQEPPAVEPPSSPPLTVRQKQDLLKSNFKKLKRDASELAELAKSLEEDIDKSNQNVFSLKVVERADKIEKLAKKIKSAAKGQ
jgi:hypothetical protein